MLWLLENFLNNEAFNFLRSKLNLGYIAFGGAISWERVEGMLFVIQGVVKDVYK